VRIVYAEKLTESHDFRLFHILWLRAAVKKFVKQMLTISTYQLEKRQGLISRATQAETYIGEFRSNQRKASAVEDHRTISNVTVDELVVIECHVGCESLPFKLHE